MSFEIGQPAALVICAVITAFTSIGATLIAQSSLSDKSVCGIKYDQMQKVVNDYSEYKSMSTEYAENLEQSYSNRFWLYDDLVRDLEIRISSLKDAVKKNLEDNTDQTISRLIDEPTKIERPELPKWSNEVIVERGGTLTSSIGKLFSLCLR